MGRRHLLIASLAMLLLAAACGGGGEQAVTAADLCAATADEQEALSSIQGGTEISGLVASRLNEDILWAHNDSGDTARVFAVGTDGFHHNTSALPGAEAIDWEDMAIGPGPREDVSYLYLGDIGDNALQRPEIHVYRAPEPEVIYQVDTPVPNDLTTAAIEKLTLRYPDRAHDAETLLVDPRTGDIIIITKELAGGPSFVFRAPGSIEPAAVTTLEEVATINFAGLDSQKKIPTDAPTLVRGVPNLPTGGDFSPDGRLIAIRTYGTVWVWDRDGEQPLWSAFASAPCEAPSEIEPQGEAIAFDADGRGYTTVSEGANPPLYHFRAE